MRIVIAAVGRALKSPEQALCDLYCERAGAFGPRIGFNKLEVILVDTSRASAANARMEEESTKLIARTPKASHRIALDEAGRSMTSEAFAAHLAHLRDSGVQDLAFLIGGPDGLAPNLRKAAHERLAFGAQTWPHLLVRAMLAEQIYRAAAILSGHPYHRGRTV